MKMNVNNDAMGNRISKTVINKQETENDKYVTTYYVRDPQGNVLAVYECKRGESGNGTLTLTEQHLYGSSRLGMKKRNLALSGSAVNESTPPVTLYELTNHLSNVVAVITDEDNGSSNDPKVESLTDYYPFGMEMGGRSYNSNDYRFGYTGHEKENDLAEGVYTTQYRLLDTRLGRWMSVDPLFGKYPDMSAYNYCGGNPVVMVDVDGRYFNDENEEKATQIQENLLCKMGELLIQKGKTENEEEQKALDERWSDLNYTYMGIEEMRNDPSKEYQYHNSETPGTYQEGSVVHMYTQENNEGNEVHESTHGGDFARNILSMANYKFSHEVTAYKSQFAYDGEFDYLPRVSIPKNGDSDYYSFMLNSDTWKLSKAIKLTKIDEVKECVIRNFCEIHNIDKIRYVYPGLRKKEAENLYNNAILNNKLKPNDKYYYLHKELILYLKCLKDLEDKHIEEYGE